MKPKLIALMTISVAFISILLGSYIYTSGASLSCPDWPTCYANPAGLTEGVFLHYAHRIVATILGLFTIALSLSVFKEKLNNKIKVLSIAAIVIVVIQGSIGALASFQQLPTITSSAHLALAIIFLAILFQLYFKVSSATQLSIEDKKVFINDWKPITRHYVLLSGFMIYLQLLMGAFVKHSAALNVCNKENSFLCLNALGSDQAALVLAYRFVSVLTLVLVAMSLVQIYRFVKRIGLSKELKDELSYHVWRGGLFLTTLVLVLTFSNLEFSTSLAMLGLSMALLLNQWSTYLLISNFEEQSFGSKQHTYISDLFGLTKPRLTTLVLVTSLIGLLLAPESMNFFKASFSLFLTALLVGSCCAFNCYMEIEVDKKMTRTSDRALPSGRLSPRLAVILSTFGMILSLVLFYFFINTTSAVLGLIAAISYLFVYTPLKVHSFWALVVGALPGAIPPLLGWSFVKGEISFLSLVIFTIVFVWQIPHFLAIAINHFEDYKKANILTYVHSKGITSTKWAILISTIALVAITLLPAYNNALGKGYQFIALLIGVAFIILSGQGLFIEREDKLRIWAKRYFKASIVYLPVLLGAMFF